MLNKIIPLCSRQYERQFNTTRIPGIETGKKVWELSKIRQDLFCEFFFHKSKSALCT